MAKKDKLKKSKHDKVNKPSMQPDSQTAASGSAYADGAPLDRVQYLEAKLILKPDRFTSVQAFRDFGKIVQRTAKKVAVGFVADREAELRPEVREIVFGDTPEFCPYNNAFILRRRISYVDGFYVDGFPVGDPEILSKHLSGYLRRPGGFYNINLGCPCILLQ